MCFAVDLFLLLCIFGKIKNLLYKIMMEEKKSLIEKTLILLKPDALSRAVCGEILSRFERRGLKIVGMKMVKPDTAFFHHHYDTIGHVISRRGKEVFDLNLTAMMKTPVIAVALEGVEAANVVRQMVGATEPKSALPGTIRGDYAHMSYSYGDSEHKAIPNLIHASGDAKEAALEIAHWFGPEELFPWERSDQNFFY
jgi:nucleoside-diphosphate kinase